MRCQKARSFLSAFCKRELSESNDLALRSHLAACAACRAEADRVESLFASVREVPRPAVSAEFTNRLMARVAQERFAQTRSEAFLPRRAPLLQWRLALPTAAAVAVTSLIAIVTFTGADRFSGEPIASGGSGAALVADYATVQPLHNPNMTANMHPGWSLQQSMRQSERFSKVSSDLRSRATFSAATLTSAQSAASTPQAGMQTGAPGVRFYLRSDGTILVEEQRPY